MEEISAEIPSFFHSSKHCRHEFPGKAAQVQIAEVKTSRNSAKISGEMNLILICDWSPCDDGGYWIWRRGGLGEQHNTSNRKSHKLDPICESTLKGVEGWNQIRKHRNALKSTWVRERKKIGHREGAMKMQICLAGKKRQLRMRKLFPQWGGKREASIPVIMSKNKVTTFAKFL